MNNTKLQQFNTLVTGIISAVLIPVLVYFILYASKLQDVHTTIFSNSMLIGNIIPIIISHCILPNLLVFFVFMGINWMQAAKGVLGTTVVLTVLIFAIKLIFNIL